MSFTPFARYRNYTLANLKALLEVYPDMARSIPWEEAKNFAEADRIRDELKARGIEIIDTPQGTKWRKV